MAYRMQPNQIGVTCGSFTEVSCQGMPSKVEHLQPGNNRYGNAFGTEIALFRTSEGGMSRMAVSWDTPGFGGEIGRLRGQKGTFYQKFEGLEPPRVSLRRPPLPPGRVPNRIAAKRTPSSTWITSRRSRRTTPPPGSPDSACRWATFKWPLHAQKER